MVALSSSLGGGDGLQLTHLSMSKRIFINYIGGGHWHVAERDAWKYFNSLQEQSKTFDPLRILQIFNMHAYYYY